MYWRRLISAILARVEKLKKIAFKGITENPFYIPPTNHGQKKDPGSSPAMYQATWEECQWEYVNDYFLKYFEFRVLICDHLLGMDMNPKQFAAPFEKYEFANHIIDSKSDLVLVPMAWLTMQPPSSIYDQAQVPDADTLAYWIQRLQPLLDNGGQGRSEETIFVACNRIGIEGDACYAGTSVVVGISKGNVKVYGCLGRGTEDLLICDVPSTAKLAGFRKR
jgi:hypothetical protein